MTTDPFASDAISEPVIDPAKDYFPDLVGEGKKYKDQTALARAVLEKDSFIEQLKRENAEARKEVSSRIAMETFLDNLNKKVVVPPADTSTQRTPPAEPVAEATKGISLEDVDNLLSKREGERSAAQNFKQSVAAAQKAFGANYQHVIEQKANEIGSSKEELAELAKKNPKAFLRLIGAENPVNPQQVAPNTSSVTLPSGFVNTGKKYKDYQELRQKDPAKWLSPSVQLEIYKAAMEQGEAFYE